MRMQLIRTHVALFLMVFISACGYHLRGAIDLPEQLKSVYVQGASGVLFQALQSSIESSNGQLVSSTDKATIRINILREEMRRRVLSISSGGKANEFSLEYNLRYILLDSNGQTLSKPQNLEIHRSYFNSQVNPLAKNNEEQIIRTEMYRQAVRSIFARAMAVLKK